jgi:hypothetical protein
LHTIAANESISTRGLEDFRLRTVSRFKVEATLSRPPPRIQARDRSDPAAISAKLAASTRNRRGAQRRKRWPPGDTLSV